MRKNIFVNENQLSFFDTSYIVTSETPKVAISLFDNQEHAVYVLEDWMRNLLPDGEFYLLCANHPLVLCVSEDVVPPEMRYRHYKIGNKVYAATGVGRGNDSDEEDSDCSC